MVLVWELVLGLQDVLVMDMKLLGVKALMIVTCNLFRGINPSMVAM
jgi:hypothetical protein